MPFIRAVHLSDGGTTAADVIEAAVSDLTTSKLRTLSVAAICSAIRRGARYRTFDERTHHQADVEVRVTYGGSRTLISVSNGVESDALLQLPRY